MDEHNLQVKCDFNIVLSEYPRSGGTWLVTLISDILGIPGRDLYATEERINDPNDPFYKGLFQHPWYKNREKEGMGLIFPCVIKSHELPDSSLVPSKSEYVQLFRDGRDVVVSKYFYEKDFCVRNGLIKEFNKSFLDFLIQTAQEWRDYVNAWLEKDVPFIKYEDLRNNTKDTLINIFKLLKLSYEEDRMNFVIKDNELALFREKLKNVCSHNTFARKGIIGDWKNYFTKQHEIIFNEIAGDTLLKLGYKKDFSWKVYYNQIKSWCC